MPKPDRFGIYQKIENVCLGIIDLIIKAAFENRNNKLSHLKTARIDTELLKRLTRISNQLNIVNTETYIDLESDLQEISKMANGWIKYLQQ